MSVNARLLKQSLAINFITEFFSHINNFYAFYSIFERRGNPNLRVKQVKFTFQRPITSSLGGFQSTGYMLSIYSTLHGRMALLLLFRQLFLVSRQRSVCVTRQRLPKPSSLVDLGDFRSRSNRAVVKEKISSEIVISKRKDKEEPVAVKMLCFSWACFRRWLTSLFYMTGLGLSGYALFVEINAEKDHENYK